MTIDPSSQAGEPPEPDPAAERDPAADAGRAAGRAASIFGRRLLRLRSVREAIRRGVEEAREPDPPPAGGGSSD